MPNSYCTLNFVTFSTFGYMALIKRWFISYSWFLTFRQGVQVIDCAVVCRWVSMQEAGRSTWWSTIRCRHRYSAEAVSFREHRAVLCTAWPICPLGDCFNTRVCAYCKNAACLPAYYCHCIRSRTVAVKWVKAWYIIMVGPLFSLYSTNFSLILLYSAVLPIIVCNFEYTLVMAWCNLTSVESALKSQLTNQLPTSMLWCQNNIQRDWILYGTSRSQ